MLSLSPELSIKQKILAAATILIIIIAAISAAVVIFTNAGDIINPSKTIHNVGTIRVFGIQVYSDSTLTLAVTEIDWEVLVPAESKSVVLFIQSHSTVPITLEKSESNWVPSGASSYLTLDWNYTGQVLQPIESIPVELTLSVSPDIQDITNFAFDITISRTS